MKKAICVLLAVFTLAGSVSAGWNPFKKKAEKQPTCHYSFQVREDLQYIFSGPCGEIKNVGVVVKRRALVLNRYLVPVLDATIPGDNTRNTFYEKYWPKLTKVEFYKPETQ